MKRYRIASSLSKRGTVIYRLQVLEYDGDQSGRTLAHFDTRGEANGEMRRRKAADARPAKWSVMSKPPDGRDFHLENASTSAEATRIAKGLRRHGHRDVQIIPRRRRSDDAVNLASCGSDRLTIVCAACNRRLECDAIDLIERFGPDTRLPAVKDALVDCQRRDNLYYDRCKAVYENPTW